MNTETKDSTVITPNKTLVIYHDADADGLLSAALMKYLRPHADFLGWDYGRPVPDVFDYDEIWMVDISVAAILDEPSLRPMVRIIDHHKTVIEKWEQYRKEFALWVVDTRFAACRLVCALLTEHPLVDQDITERYIDELPIVFLVGLRDSWKHDGTKYEAQCNHLALGLRANWPPPFDNILRYHRYSWTMIDDIVKDGEAISRYAASQTKEVAERGAYTIQHKGVTFLVLNSLLRGSKILDQFSRDNLATMPHDALMVWGISKEQKAVFSMYHASHRKDIDLSAIAKAHGGGGHPGACGFILPINEAINIVNP